MMPDKDQTDLLADLDTALDIIRQRHRLAVLSARGAVQRVHTTADTLYGALRRRQAVRVEAGVEAPVPCRDCLVEVAVEQGAGSYHAGYVHHELIYEGRDELPYATCGAARAL